MADRVPNESRTESPRSGLLRWRVVGAIVAATPVTAWWLQRLVAIPSSGWFTPGRPFALGNDLRTFRLAAYLVTHGGGGSVYDPSAFRALAGASPTGGYIANPPPFLALIAPLGWLPFEAAWWIVAGLSVVGLVFGLRLLGVTRPVLTAAALLAFPPVYFTITYGQMTILWFVVLAGTYRLLDEDRQVSAGIVAGLMVMKPTLAFGLLLWWVIDWRRFRVAALAAATSAAGYLGLSFLIVPTVWRGFIGSFTELFFAPGYALRQWAQFSLWSTWRIVFPGRPALASVAGILSVVTVLVIIIPLLRRTTDLHTGFSVALLLTMLASPYVIAYDWSLLIIPAVLLWRRSPVYRSRLEPGFLAIAIASAWSTVIVIAMLDRYGFALQPAPFVLLALVWWYRPVLAPAR